MRRHLAHLLVFICLFTVVLSVSGFIHPIHVNADVCEPGDADWDMSKCGEKRRASINPVESIKDALLFLPGWISIAVLQVAQLLVWMSGVLLNKVVQFTVIDMANNLEGVAINNAWATIRDVANMSFIFVLLYASIQLILGIGKNTRQLIVNMIIVALLINFSLFFTKIVIDSSNLLAVMFYKAIAPGVLTESFNGGIANTIMEPLKLQSIAQDVSALDGSKLIIIGVMGTIFCVIAAFIFFAISIMFIVRFAVLIFLLILSPIAFIAMILPQAGKYRSQWINALMGQSFFAPIYFLLTWIVIVISKGLLTSDKGFGQALIGTTIENPQGQLVAKAGDIGIIMNFIIMIVFLVFSLVVAKEWAGKAGSGVSKATNWLTGKAGNAGFGAVGWSGRKSLGWAGGKIAENPNIVSNANDKNANWSTRASARLALYAGKKARSGTYDPRNMTIPTNAIGDAIQGTVGRTKIGKKLGLDDVNIASIGVGKIASDRVGVGEAATKGQYELDSEKKKKLRDEDKERAEELRKSETKEKIRLGTEADKTAKNASRARTPAEQLLVDEMVRAIKNMTDKEIEGQKAETLAIKDVAENLSSRNLEAIQKSTEYSEAEKKNILDSHFAPLMEAIDKLHLDSTGAVPLLRSDKERYENILRNMSEKEIDLLEDSMFDVDSPASARVVVPATATTPAITAASRAKQLTGTLIQPQIDKLTGGNRLTTTQKQKLKDERKRQLAAVLDPTSPTYNAAAARAKLIKTKPMKEIGKLDITWLTNPDILDAYKPKMLAEMAAEMTPVNITTLRTEIINRATLPGATPALQSLASWLITPAGDAAFS